MMMMTTNNKVVWAAGMVVVFVFVSTFRSSAAVVELPGVTPLPQGGGADDERVLMMLVAPDGQIDLRDTPAGDVVKFTRPAGTTVWIVDEMEVAGKIWFLVELDGEAGNGWVPAGAVTIPGATRPTFQSFVFCAGSSLGPDEPCGESLPVTAERLWLRWEYAGLKHGDQIQRVLIVNGERFQNTPQLWNGPRAGQHLVDLMADHGRAIETGRWTMQFIVNGEFAGEATLTIE